MVSEDHNSRQKESSDTDNVSEELYGGKKETDHLRCKESSESAKAKNKLATS